MFEHGSINDGDDDADEPEVCGEESEQKTHLLCHPKIVRAFCHISTTEPLEQAHGLAVGKVEMELSFAACGEDAKAGDGHVR